MTRPETRGHRGATRGGSQRRETGIRPASFAVLYTSSQPLGEQFLRTADGSPSLIEFRYQPIHHIKEAGANFGILSLNSSLNTMRPGDYQVQKANKKRSGIQRLLALGRAPAGYSMLPQVRQTGMAKAVGRAVLQVAEGSKPEPIHWWIAVELAEQGYVEREAIFKAGKDFSSVLPTTISGCKRIGDLFIWEEFLERKADELEKTAEKQARRNPLIDRISARQVSRWMGLARAELCDELVKIISVRSGQKITSGPLGLSVRYVRPDDFPLPSDGDKKVLAEIQQLMNSEESRGRRGLHELFPSSINIVEHMFGAEQLIDAPDGYVFTRAQIEGFLSKLTKKGRMLEQVGVREIKDELQLKRRGAEGLRSFISGLSEVDEEAELNAAGEGL